MSMSISCDDYSTGSGFYGSCERIADVVTLTPQYRAAARSYRNSRHGRSQQIAQNSQMTGADGSRPQDGTRDTGKYMCFGGGRHGFEK
jgi:hypothetical protein